jgi:hypothetical protein
MVPIAAGAIVLFASTMLYFLVIKDKPAPNPIPVSIKSSLTFPSYYPSKLPDGFSILDNGVTQPEKAKDVVIIHIKDTNGRTVDISDQAMPSSFDFDQFFGSFESKADHPTPVGNATIGIGDDHQLLAAIKTSRTLVIMNTSHNLTTEEFNLILDNLKAD